MFSRRLVTFASFAIVFAVSMGAAVADLKTITNDGQNGNPEIVSSNPEGTACMKVTFHTLVSGSSAQAMTKFTVKNAQGGEYTITIDPHEDPITLQCEWIEVWAEELGSPTEDPNNPGTMIPSKAACHVIWRQVGT